MQSLKLGMLVAYQRHWMEALGETLSPSPLPSFSLSHPPTLPHTIGFVLELTLLLLLHTHTHTHTHILWQYVGQDSCIGGKAETNGGRGHRYGRRCGYKET